MRNRSGKDMGQDSNKFVGMQEVNSTYSTKRCQATLSEEGLMQDAVCDVLPYSSTEAIVYAGQNF
jgi:hypothetical protein